MFNSILQLLHVLVGGVLQVGNYIIYLLTSVFSYFVSLVGYLTGLNALERYIPYPIVGAINILISLFVATFIVSGVSWIISIIRG